MNFLGIPTKKLLGIELVTSDQGSNIHALELVKSKNEINIAASYTAENFKDLASKAAKQTPVYLVINTEHVLLKKGALASDDSAVLTAFPNLKLDEFYIESSSSSEASFISICRKDYVDSLLEESKEAGFLPVGFSLGCMPMLNLNKVLDNGIYFTTNAEVHVSNKALTTIKKGVSENGSYEINGLHLESSQLLAFAGAYSYYVGAQETTTNFQERNDSFNRDFKQYFLFNTGYKIALGVIFSLLLISFIFFSYYNEKTTYINAALQSKNSQVQTLKELREQVDFKKDILNRYSGESSKVSWYMDQIGQSVPGSVLLTEINYQPVERAIKEGEEIALLKNTILIKGSSLEPERFATWVSQLEQADWVSQLQYNEYGTGKKTNESFELQIEVQ